MSEVNHSKHGLLVLVRCVIRLISLSSNLLLYVSTSLDIANFAMLYNYGAYTYIQTHSLQLQLKTVKQDYLLTEGISPSNRIGLHIHAFLLL